MSGPPPTLGEKSLTSPRLAPLEDDRITLGTGDNARTHCGVSMPASGVIMPSGGTGAAKPAAPSRPRVDRLRRGAAAVEGGGTTKVRGAAASAAGGAMRGAVSAAGGSGVAARQSRTGAALVNARSSPGVALARGESKIGTHGTARPVLHGAVKFRGGDLGLTFRQASPPAAPELATRTSTAETGTSTP